MSSKFVVTGEGEQPVVYPARLCDNHRETAARYLGVLAPEQRQPILDELEGRFRAEAKGMKPVYDEISFLHAFCKRARQGKFQPNLGIKVRKGRRAKERPGCNEPGRQRARSANERDEGRQQRKADSQAHLTGLRKLLGMSEGTEKQ